MVVIMPMIVLVLVLVLVLVIMAVPGSLRMGCDGHVGNPKAGDAGRSSVARPGRCGCRGSCVHPPPRAVV